ncbi:MAG TPA: hypothetical protein H9943_08990 [Candidatus Ruthenibacterium avium]|uniref:Uncharacterized protein n=1 Tax=Candidatus Ruthenibacterium avium TaxID=2838751 RepID=A0A9D2M2Z0_9FIRM|nr:hypothetical protein [Candidatus Ruthenibacterium avium]
MFDNEYRSAMQKIEASDAWRAETLQKMRNAQQESGGVQMVLAQRRRASRRWGAACAAALVLAAIPVTWQMWHTPALEQSTAAGGAVPQTVAAEPFAVSQSQPMAKERAAVFDAAPSEPNGQEIHILTVMNPTENLTQDELPDTLPLYYENVQADGEEMLEQTAEALGVTAQHSQDGGQTAYAMEGAWKLSVQGDAVRVEAESGVLMPLEEGVSKEIAPDFYARRLSGNRTWHWDGADAKNAQCFALSDEALDKQLYRYCFEHLSMELDDNGNLKALECRLPQLQRGQAMALVSLEQAREAAALSAESVQSTQLSYVRDEAGVWSPVYVFTTKEENGMRWHEISAVQPQG